LMKRAIELATMNSANGAGMTAAMAVAARDDPVQ
jgi:hypothetical protein